jgi:peptidoglycan/LPS O-acetylase OafA/YrhL
MVSNNLTKIDWADGIRGLAAITVIFQHFINTFFPKMNGAYLPNDSEGWQFMTYPMLRSIYAGNFSVHVFFVLSGIVVPFRYLVKGANDLSIIQSSLIRRPARLFVPILPLSFISYIMYLGNAYKQASDLKFLSIMQFKPKFRNFGQFLLDTFIGIWMEDGDTYIPQAWTLSYEMMGSILLYVVLVGIHGLKTRYRIAFTIMLSCFFGVASTFYGIMLIYYHDFLIGLLIGMFIIWKNKRIEINSGRSKYWNIMERWLGLAFFLLGLFFGSYPLFIVDDASYWHAMKKISDATALAEKFWYSLGGTFLIFGIVLCDWLQYFFSIKPFAFIGKISYPLYLIHLQIMASAGVAIYKALNQRAHFDHGKSAMIMLFLYFIILIPLSWLGIYVLDIPSIKVGRWLENKVKNKPFKQQNVTILPS